MSKPESYPSVWDAIADTPEQAANLRRGLNSCRRSRHA